MTHVIVFLYYDVMHTNRVYKIRVLHSVAGEDCFLTSILFLERIEWNRYLNRILILLDAKWPKEGQKLLQS